MSQISTIKKLSDGQDYIWGQTDDNLWITLITPPDPSSININVTYADGSNNYGYVRNIILDSMAYSSWYDAGVVGTATNGLSPLQVFMDSDPSMNYKTRLTFRLINGQNLSYNSTNLKLNIYQL